MFLQIQSSLANLQCYALVFNQRLLRVFPICRKPVLQIFYCEGEPKLDEWKFFDKYSWFHAWNS